MGKRMKWEQGRYKIALHVIMPDGSSIQFHGTKGLTHTNPIVKAAADMLAAMLKIEKLTPGLERIE